MIWEILRGLVSISGPHTQVSDIVGGDGRELPLMSWPESGTRVLSALAHQKDDSVPLLEDEM